MESVTHVDYVAPNARIPKIIGILNIVFAAQLLICGLCVSGYYALIPFWVQATNRFQQQVQAKQQAKNDAEVQRLEEDEAKATTEREKTSIRAKRDAVQKRPKIVLAGQFDLAAAGFNVMRLRMFAVTEFVTGTLLNLMLLASGIGMVMRRRWGLRLGLWTAALKLLRLTLLYGYAAVAIVPGASQAMAKVQMQAIEQQQAALGQPIPPRLSTETMANMIAITTTICAVGLIVVGAIYPLISFWFLSRPAAWAACSTSDAPLGPNETW